MKNRMSDINKAAWAIRRAAASKYECPIMSIIWKPCFIQAKEEVMGEIKDGQIIEGFEAREWKGKRIYFSNSYKGHEKYGSSKISFFWDIEKKEMSISWRDFLDRETGKAVKAIGEKLS